MSFWNFIFGGLLIMMGSHTRSEALFYYFRLEDQVPENHLLRLIEKHISFEFVRERFAGQLQRHRAALFLLTHYIFHYTVSIANFARLQLIWAQLRRQRRGGADDRIWIVRLCFSQPCCSIFGMISCSLLPLTCQSQFFGPHWST